MNTQTKSSPATPIHHRLFTINLIIAFQIIGIILFLFLLIAVPQLYKGPFFILYILSAVLLIPTTVVLSYGLYTGREWARFYSRLFQVINITSAILQFSLFGLIFPVAIYIYLGRPEVIDSFATGRDLEEKYHVFILAMLILIVIVNSMLAVYANPYVQRALHH